MLVEVRVCELRLDSDNKIGLVVLKETDGDRLLRIYIGEAEALAIAYHLESLSVARPLTHDLLCSVLQGLGGSLQRVVITKVEERTYYAELLLQRNGEIIGLDARPSDSIALARAGRRGRPRSIRGSTHGCWMRTGAPARRAQLADKTIHSVPTRQKAP